MRVDVLVEFMGQRVALITGSGKRIGAAIATKLLSEGWFVFLHVRSSLAEAQLLLDEYQRETGIPATAEIVKADLVSDGELNQLIEHVLAHESVKNNGGLHGLVHNASIYNSMDFEEVSLAELRLNNRIHVEVPFLLTQRLIEPLKNANGCVIGMIDTSLGRAWKGLSHYTSSKAALRQLMMNLAGDLAPEVRVNCVAPGAIMAAEWEAEHFASVVEKIPLGRAGEVEDVANTVNFLLDSPYLSGQIIEVDGGWSVAP